MAFNPYGALRINRGNRIWIVFHLYWCSKRGDKLLQHVAATDHSACTGRATSCSKKVRRHVAATNRFVCTGEFLWNLCLRNRIWSLQQVAKNQIRLNLCDLLRRQILWQRQRFSQKFSSTHEAFCRCNVLPRHVAATCRLVCTDLKLSTMHIANVANLDRFVTLSISFFVYFISLYHIWLDCYCWDTVSIN